jgi:hypothetical protein
LAWKLSLLSDATSTKTLSRKENASKKFSQEPLRRRIESGDPESYEGDH